MQFSGRRNLMVDNLQDGTVLFREQAYYSTFKISVLKNLLDTEKSVDYSNDIRISYGEDSLEILTERGTKSYTIQNKELRKLKGLLK